MNWKFLLPLLASIGLLVAIVTVFQESSTPEPQAGPGAVPTSPYNSFVAGAGIIEARHGNIEIGSPVSGIVSELLVKVGDHVKAGDPLFRIDDRDLQAQLSTAEARLKVAEAEARQPKHQLKYNQGMVRRDSGAVSAQRLTDLRDQLAAAQANLRLAQAQINQIKVEIDRHLVRAPVGGQVLRLTLRLGEYLAAGGTAPLLLFGQDKSLYLRVNVDETDAWRVKPGAPAVAFAQGNPHIRVPLKFEYVEPYVVPKTSLTGQPTERSDTRVLQVLYSFDRDDKPLYIGQQMDVFIQSRHDPRTNSGN